MPRSWLLADELNPNFGLFRLGSSSLNLCWISAQNGFRATSPVRFRPTVEILHALPVCVSVSLSIRSRLLHTDQDLVHPPEPKKERVPPFARSLYLSSRNGLVQLNSDIDRQIDG